jgi:hypothetical protein
MASSSALPAFIGILEGCIEDTFTLLLQAKSIGTKAVTMSNFLNILFLEVHKSNQIQYSIYN